VNSEGSQAQTADWLLDRGPRELELLFRAIVFHPSAPILIADNDRKYRDASAGAAKLLGLSRDKIIGNKIDDFAAPAFKPEIESLWSAFLEQGEQHGMLRLAGPDGTLWDVEYTAKGNVLPVRHLLVLRGQAGSAQTRGSAEVGKHRVPSWVQDFALYLVDVDGHIAAWYSGAERIYGYAQAEIVGKHLSILYPGEARSVTDAQQELRRSAAEGHFGNEVWHVKKDGSRFWANVITMALRDDNGELRGFARVVRDFSERHERDETLRRSRALTRPVPVEPSVPGMISGEFDLVPEANDAFLQLAGYSREDLQAGRLRWPDLTPPEHSALDDLAHEECLRFRACTPYERELIRKDGSRIPVLLTTVVLNLSPFRWITLGL
jgi:PAS domain S-box-containing protein